MRNLACPNQEVSGNVALLFLYSESYAVAVAPFTGAWIETDYLTPKKATNYVAPFTGAWIETRRENAPSFDTPGRSLHGSVD